MEDTFSYGNSGDHILVQKPLPLGLSKYTKPSNDVYFSTESYEDQFTNRKEDGTIIPLGYPVNLPMTKNGSKMKFDYYQGTSNPLDLNKRQQTEPLQKRDTINPLEQKNKIIY